ncbi:DASS family sodium-coupled anion symporter [Proteiniborus sp. MB09-C3]|uniref:SLC13 family permease n=1 Tax=Proteiniborus sp. MB09-C3 TaxID=3050072 RepID=UPI002555A465|nr:DASS family sodium-coupled anion symporter [Proteiniborus sp. MB09-C3]WIV12291.1 DASS family sodium-coupled anion symporter [Proteiniborus sp. MB09-C3]
MGTVKKTVVEKKSSYNKGQMFGLILGIALFLLVYYFIPFENLSKEGKGVLATLALIGTWWMTEAANTGIVGLVPLVLFPLTQTLSPGATAAAYGSNTVFMFFGGFAIALALEKWNLHNRIALSIINIVGTSMTKLIVGLMLSATFISMWVSNTATMLMLLPIAQAIGSKIVELMEREDTYSKKNADNFKKSVVFAVGFGAIIGGSMTLIGTPTNISLSGFTSQLLGYELSFAQFTFFEFPVALAQFILMVFILTKVFYKISIKEVEQGRSYIAEEKKALGKMSNEEKVVSAVFIGTVFMWVTVSFIWKKFIPGISDTVVSIIACILLYLLPSRSTGGRILEADSVKKMPWAVILMLQGGMAIAAGFTQTDLAQWIGNQLMNFQGQPEIVVIMVVTLLALLVTQFAPNTATGTIMIPIAASLSNAIGINPLYLMTAAALGAGFASTLPSGTPLMGIIYGTGDFKMGEMVKVGISLVFVSFIMIVLSVKFILPLFFAV